MAVERVSRAAGIKIGYYERDTLTPIGDLSPDGNVLCLVGWFSHSPLWPLLLSHSWTPLFLGYHDSASELNGRRGALRELADRSPWAIGCRDSHTADVFRRAGVPEERILLSGCATLTLPDRDTSTGLPLAVDVPPDVRRRLLGGVSPVRELTSHWMPEDVARNGEKRREAILQAVERLSRARVVATTRLHAALPALAAGRQVIFLRRDPLEARLSDYLRMFPLVRGLADLDAAPVTHRDVARASLPEGLREGFRERSQHIVRVLHGLVGASV